MNVMIEPAPETQKVIAALPENVSRCVDISGQDPELLTAIYKKYGCNIDLVAVPDNGNLDNLEPVIWTAATLSHLRAQGVPDAAVHIISDPAEVQPGDVVLALNSFSASKKVKPLQSALSAIATKDTVLLADIRNGSGGFRFFKQFGTTKVLDVWHQDGEKHQRTSLVIDTLPNATPVEEPWSVVAARLVGDKGFYRENENHSFTYVPRSDVLCVTFDNLDIAMNKREERRPWGFGFIEAQGWSMLGVMANGWTWYRDPWVFEQFDTLRESGFFRQFRRVIFYGASMGGYAAIVFSSACPGAEVVAFSPQSTLDKKLVPWESRYVAAWGYDYSGPYGDAAMMSASAHRISLFYDPYMPLDKGHIDRLSGDNLVHMRCPFLGHRLGSMLQQMGILQTLVLGAMAGEITPAEVNTLLRKRREFRRYRVEMVQRLIERKHPKLAAQLCRYVLKNGRNDRFFRRTLAELGDV